MPLHCGNIQKLSARLYGISSVARLQEGPKDSHLLGVHARV